MVYQVSKNKLSKDLKPIIESFLIGTNKTYVEPFVGGANMIDKIDWENKYGYDINKYLIALHQENQSRILPVLNCERSAYNFYRDVYNKKERMYIADWEVGYYGFLMSYNGRFFDGGYGVFDKSGKNLFIRRLKNLIDQRKRKQYWKTIFRVRDFKELDLWNSVIYLDPPYQNTKQYSYKFQHKELWDWCEKMGSRERYNIILLSELTKPNDDWEEIWSQEHQYTLRDKNNKNKKVVEKLFLYKGKND